MTTPTSLDSSAVSADFQLQLTAAERSALDSAIDNYYTQKAQATRIGNLFLSYVAMQKLKSYLPQDQESYQDRSLDGSKELGIICFDHLDPNLIVAIIDYIELYRNSYKLNNPGFFCDLDCLSFKIPRHTIVGASQKLTTAPNVTITTADASWWRNHLEKGKFIVTAVTSGENVDTTANLLRLGNDQIKEILDEQVLHFIDECSSALGVTITDNKLERKPLERLISLLAAEDAAFNTTAAEIAQYLGMLIIHYRQHHDLRRAFGEALPVLRFPFDPELFTQNKLKDATKVLYRKELAALTKNRISYRAKYNQDNTTPLKYEVLTKTFLSLEEAAFAADGGAANDTVSISEDGKPVDKRPSSALFTTTEAALIKNYLQHFEDDDGYGKIYELLCLVPWHGKLEKFFLSKQSKVKVKLSERTLALFDDEAYGEEDQLSDDERATIALVDHKSDSAAETQALYDFFQKKRRIFDAGTAEAKSISKEWQKLIFSDKIECDDFLVGLSQVILRFLSSDQGGKAESAKLAKLSIKFNFKRAKLHEINYAVATYFSCRYGPLLSELIRAVPQFEFTFKDAESSQAEPHPLLNYPKYFAAQQKRSAGTKNKLKASTSVSKENTTLVFDVTPTFADGRKGTTLKLTWAMPLEGISTLLWRNIHAVYESHTLQSGVFAYNEFSLQGGRQALNLAERQTFQGVGSQRYPVGVFFNPHPSLAQNVSQLFREQLSALNDTLQQVAPKLNAEDVSLAQQSLDEISALFTEVESSYLAVVELLHDCHILTAQVSCLAQQYAQLQYTIMVSPVAEMVQRCGLNVSTQIRLLLQLLQQIGMAYIADNRSANATLAATFSDNDSSTTTTTTTTAGSGTGSSDSGNSSGAMGVSAAHGDLDMDSASSLAALSHGALSNQNYSQYAVATPLCIESLRSYAFKLERLKELMQALFAQSLYLTDPKQFQDSLKSDFSYCEAPEVVLNNCLPRNSQILLFAQSVGGFSLYTPASQLQETLRHSAQASSAAAVVSNSTTTTRAKRGSSGYGAMAVYVDACHDFLRRYLTTRPYLQEQCTLMLYNCALPTLPLHLYRMLVQAEDLARTHFNLLVVNRDLQEAKNVYRLFEAERFNLQQSGEHSDFVQRVQVSVLTTLSETAGSISAYNNLYELHGSALTNGGRGSSSNQLSLRPAGDSGSLHRIADLCLIAHVFDSTAQVSFSPVAVPVATDEVNFQPTLISFVAPSTSERSSKYLVCPVQPITKIQYLHALQYIAQGTLETFTPVAEQIKSYLRFNCTVESEVQRSLTLGLHAHGAGADADAAEAEASTEEPSAAMMAPATSKGAPNDAHELAATIVTPLVEYFIRLNNTTNQSGVDFGQLISHAHNYADVVLYFDTLLNRGHLQDEGIKVIYYHKLKDAVLNFMVATTAPQLAANSYLQTLLSKMGVADNEQAALQERLRADAIAISGSIVMRSDLRRINTYELVGLVLSKTVVTAMMQQVTAQLQAQERIEATFICLDDYAALFSINDSSRADLLGMQVVKYATPQAQGHQYLLMLTVVESKFLSQMQAVACKKSLKQTRATTDIFANALAERESISSLDRRQFLARLADMLLDSRGSAQGSLAKIDDQEFALIQQLLREEQIDILLKGYSLVYAHEADTNELLPVAVQTKLSPDPRQKHAAAALPILQVQINKSALEQLFTDYRHGINPLPYLLKADSSEHLAEYVTATNHIMALRPSTLPPLALSAMVEVLAYERNPEEPAPSPQKRAPSKSATVTPVNTTATTSSAATSTTNTVAATTSTPDAAAPVPEQQSVAGIESESEAEAVVPSGADLPPVSTPVSNAPKSNAPASSAPEASAPVHSTPESSTPRPTPLAPHRIAAEDNTAADGNDNGSDAALADTATATDQDKEQRQEFYAEHPHFAQLLDSTHSTYELETPEKKQWLEHVEHELVAFYREKKLLPIVEDKKLTANGAIFEFQGNSRFEKAALRKANDSVLSRTGFAVSGMRERPRKIVLFITEPAADSMGRTTIPYLALAQKRTFKYEYFTYEGERYHGCNMRFVLGLSDEDASIVYLEPDAIPHTLIAGGTGSGKSVLLRTLITDIALTNAPEDAQIILVDPKSDDFGDFAPLPHLYGGQIIKDQQQTIAALHELHAMMEERYARFSALGQKLHRQGGSSYLDIARFNAVALDQGEAILPHMFFVMDEFADYFIDPDFRRETTADIQRLGNKGRAAGIHLIFATQRPDSETVDARLKSNCDNRIALKMADSVNSRIVLTSKTENYDASKLLGRGQMICELGGKPVMAQSAYLSATECRDIVNAIVADYEGRKNLS